MRNRRTVEGYKLRVLIDAIKDVKAMSDAQWLAQWVSHAVPSDRYITRSMWLSYLEACALMEAEKFATPEAA